VVEVKSQTLTTPRLVVASLQPAGRLSATLDLVLLELLRLVTGRTPKNAGNAVSEIRPFLRLRSQVKSPVKDSV